MNTLTAAHIFYFCFLLGLGAAAPLGPVNFEIIRRNLRGGFARGLIFGLGACCADLTYLILLLVGVVSLLGHPVVLGFVGLLGSIVIAWFGYEAVRSRAVYVDRSVKPEGWFKSVGGGYLMTIVNPYTVLFWASISTQIAGFGRSGGAALIWGGVGVLVGTFSWVMLINLLMHFSRRVINDRFIKFINVIGGLLLILIAVYGFLHSASVLFHWFYL